MSNTWTKGMFIILPRIHAPNKHIYIYVYIYINVNPRNLWLNVMIYAEMIHVALRVWFSRVKRRPVFMIAFMWHVFDLKYKVGLRGPNPIKLAVEHPQKGGLLTPSLSILSWSLYIVNTCKYLQYPRSSGENATPSETFQHLGKKVKKGRCGSKDPIFRFKNSHSSRFSQKCPWIGTPCIS